MATTEWEQLTIGQNKKIQEVVAAASKASDLLNENVSFAKTGLQTAQVFLQGILNPKILLLTAIADEIDKFVEDLKGTGFFILECANPEDYVIPKDADGNPIKLALSSVGIAAAATAAASAGLTKDFAKWAKDSIGEDDIYLTGAQKAEYEVDIKKAKPPESRTGNRNDDRFAEKDEVTGLYKMTPSQMIATMISAMDDELDKRRPTFTSSAEAGAVVFLIGLPDLTKNTVKLMNILDAFLLFFGGKNGLLTGGARNLAGLFFAMAGGAGWITDEKKCQVPMTVNNICGVRGDEDDEEKLKQSGIDYNYTRQFEVNDFVVGPRVKFGSRCKGFISSIEETTEDTTTDTTIFFDKTFTYSTQKITITGVTDSDAIAFRTLGSGAKIQTVGYKRIPEEKFIDQNSGEPQTRGPFNDYVYFGDMKNDGTEYENPKAAITKVERDSDFENNFLLKKVGSGVDITEEHTLRNYLAGTDNAGKFTTFNSTMGDVFKTVDNTAAPPPNFKAAKLEELIGEFTTFFASIKFLTDTLRNIAKGSGEALEKIVKFLDSKIKELEEINKALQAILTLFTTGLPDAGIYTLVIPPAVGGNDYIKSELQAAANRPPDSLEFTFAFMMVGGSASTKTLQTLLTAGSA